LDNDVFSCDIKVLTFQDYISHFCASWILQSEIQQSVLYTLTRQVDRPISNGMAILSREDTMLQSLADVHCSSAV